MNKKYFNILIFIIIIIIIYYNLSNNNMVLKIKKTDFVKINKKLDNEHDKIFDAIDKLYEICAQHWKTEDEMYKKGKKKMPKDHKNISVEWKEHVKEHNNLLKKIRDMKSEIVTHIKKQDVKHFHWT